MGHPVLRQIAEPVPADSFADPDFQRFCDDMIDTLIEYDGAGLAAPQVHASIRLALIALSDEEEPEFFVNPRVEVLTQNLAATWEGCLSVEGLRGRVERPDHIRVTFLDRFGEPKGYELQGFPAVVVQHELDHLDGILYVDRADPRTLAFLKEYRKWGAFDPEGTEELSYTAEDTDAIPELQDDLELE
jgi:peptide deformylase